MQIRLDKNLRRILIGQLVLMVVLLILSASLISKNLKDLRKQVAEDSKKIIYKLELLEEMTGILFLEAGKQDKFVPPDSLPNKSKGIKRR